MTLEKSWSFSVWLLSSEWDWAGSFDCCIGLLWWIVSVWICVFLLEAHLLTNLVGPKTWMFCCQFSHHNSSWRVHQVLDLVQGQAREVRPPDMDLHGLLRNCSFGLGAEMNWLVAFSMWQWCKGWHLPLWFQGLLAEYKPSTCRLQK